MTFIAVTSAFIVATSAGILFFLFGWLVLKQPKWVERAQMSESERRWHDFLENFGISPVNTRFLRWEKIVQGVVDEELTRRIRKLHDSCAEQTRLLEEQKETLRETNTLKNPDQNKDLLKRINEIEVALGRVEIAIQVRKEEFWTPRALVQKFGYDVKFNHCDYLVEEDFSEKKQPEPATA